MRREEGFSLVELLVAITVLATGIFAVIGVLDTSRRLSLVAERQTTLTHRAQQELERVQALPYAQIAMTRAPSHGTDPSNPDYYVTTTGQLQYDRSDPASTEPLAIDAAGAINPSLTDGSTGTWQEPSAHLSGKIYTFVSWHYDSVCGGSSPLCDASKDYKRVTVMLTQDGATHPSKPVIVSTFVADPRAAPNGYTAGVSNPISAPGAKCLDGNGNPVSCGSGIGTDTPLTYFLSDSPYDGTYQPPAGDNNLHQTVNNFVCNVVLNLLCPPKPDQLTTTLPTTGGSQPPCFTLDLGCVLSNGSGTGTKITHPSTDSSSCGSPPNDNGKMHGWVTPAVPAGTTLHLTGRGAMTLYLQSASAVSVNATVCLGLYVVPSGLLGSLTGSLLQYPIGATASARVQAAANVPTPVSFQFNVGQAADVSSTTLNLARVEVVVWLAASAGTDVGLVYDHPDFASQLELMTQ